MSLESAYKIVAGICLLTCSSLLGAGTPACFVQVPVYDASGRKLPFVISGVFKVGERKLGDLLQLQETRDALRTVGERLYFPKSAMGALLEIQLKGPNGAPATAQLALNACQQRSSVQYGELDSGADVRTSEVTGRISGCSLDGDWWIKATPMFGEYAQMGVFEGLIKRDGAFAIVASMHGGRHIVVVGKDREPVKAFSAEIVRGGNNEVGDIDLRGLCPK